MSVNNVLDLASRQASWLLARENLVAQNVAHANTPGYRTSDLKPFEGALQAATLQLAKTSAGHLDIAESDAEPDPDDLSVAKDGTSLSGNNVSLEWEMLKGGEISRAYSLNTAVVKAFNGMLVQAGKG